ncbi:DNA mismatch repair protein MSH6 isoform X2 [Durio zibethinus]|uniref:DNA mismatch repair protein n=1 Tax=Durio zibethinus TaxID=66656 RepID=A0A6P5ZZG7_DURZI|nr:DNA mismatch repair protein MSH6 isoform X2 [Durio zibethinus]
MASSRRQSNGRSPLVNQQRHITSFFSKTNSPSPSPSPTFAKQTSKLNPNPKPNRSPSKSPSPSLITPSPAQSKPKKPLLVIGQTPSPTPSTPVEKSYGKEVLEKRIRVYWPLDKAWYEGVVKFFDKESGKHLVQYDDAEEEELDLGKEKIEWVKESTGRLKRLRRGGTSSAFKKVVIDFEDEDVAENGEEKSNADDDDSSDEDWGENVAKEVSEDAEEEDMDLVDEKEEEEDEELEEEEEVMKMWKRKGGGKTESKKRKACGGGGKLESGKKSKTGASVGNKEEFKLPLVEPVKKTESDKASNGFDNALVGEASERFGKREAEKFYFLGPKERRDVNRKRPGDINYNPKTLYMPPDFLKSLSGGQRQWWEFKSKHMDKVLFFKMGKFYELFEMDAHIGAKELDLQYMKGEQPHCGFPERNFSMNVEKLARKGYRVLVVEQTETPEQLELRRKEKGAKDKVVKREICAVVTKGTITEGEMLSTNPDPSYLMAVTENCQSSTNQNEERVFGVCAVDVSTSRIILGQFGDDSECSALCCLLAELRPVEIIKPTKLLSFETEKAMLRHTRNPLVNELLPSAEFWDADKTVHEIKTFYKRIKDQSAARSVSDVGPNDANSSEEDRPGCLPAVLSNLLSAGANGSLALSALGGTLYYLKQAFLDETLLRFAKFESLPSSGFSGTAPKPYMFLDAAALENLEIFENSRNGDSYRTLYEQLNHCVTAFGKRLLKTWLARPLYQIDLIKERQDAVAGLKGENQSYAVEFRKALSRLPDMERLLARIFASSEANGRNANKVILYEDAAKKQLQEFVSALRGCELMVQACSSLGVILENVESTQLHHLLTAGLPNIHSILKHFKDAFDWVDANNSGRIIPHEGVDLEYDSACEKVKEIESSLTKHLKEQRKLLGDSSITYVTVGKEVYLLEVPENLRGSVPQDYELRSSKKGFFRYWTPYIKKSLGELSQAESEKETALKNILQRLLGRFCEDHNKWRQLVSTTGELDVLISLAIASDFYEGPTCRPFILGFSCSNEVPCFSAKGLGHPILRSDSLGKGAFVPNDITIGGSGHASFLLLTGPNMGGKSTLLRQVCLAVILAQVGADVPAEHLELSPVDRIFVRMGAKDHIMAGQSTFLTELSETALMLSSATKHSLVALDELGRGTSTSDGQAIAESVLEHFVHKVQCRGMFSTHYHRLAVDYQNNSKVFLCHMACQVGNGNGVEGVEEVTFLYRLTTDACPKSYGVNVARIAGLPDSILLTAASKSREFEAIYGKHRKECEDNLPIQSCPDKMVAIIRELISVTANARNLNTLEGTSVGSLTELQRRARTLLLQQH